MDEDGGEKFIVPALADDNEGSTYHSFIDVSKSNNERGNSSHEVDNADRVTASSCLDLSINSDDSFPTILSSSHHTDLKDNKSKFQQQKTGRR